MIVTVIIPVYNASLLLERCLNSVFRQTGDFMLDVICIDDGSTDNSVKIIENYDKPINLIRQSNQGPAPARNKGIKAAKGKYLAFLDADDYWKPDFLKETTCFLENNTEAVAVSTGQIHKSVSSNSRTQPQFLIKDANDKNSYIIEDFFKLWKEQEIVCTGSVLMLTSIAKEIGGQQPKYRVMEDIEFWACIGAIGKWGFIPKILFVSDGIGVTKQQGWLDKNIQRWESAPLVEEWEKRILQLSNGRLPKSYYLFRGKIAGNLIYSMIMSNKKMKALKTFKKYKSDIPKNKFSLIYNIASKNKISWNIMCFLLIKREYNRKI